MSKGNKKEQNEDDSTLRLLQGFKKRCDNFGIVPAPVIKGKLDEAFEGGKGAKVLNPKF